MKIKLTNSNLMAEIDKKDYNLCSKYRWFLRTGTHNNYAMSGKIFLHQLILGKPNKGLEIDHINGNGLDNRRKNLRIVTHSQNMMNVKTRINKNSKYKGVCWDKDRNKFKADICLNRKTIFIGRYKTELEAVKAYNKKAKELFGEYARLNKIVECDK